MLTLRKVAVTGGLSAGKTTVCQFFKTLGAYVVSTDEIVHRLLSNATPISKRVIELLGPDIVIKGQIDRQKVADLVFANPKQLTDLEALVHPVVFDEIERDYKQASQQRYPLFVAEVPLLYEIHQEDRFDVVIAVSSEETLCKSRFLQKGKNITDPKEFTLRMKRQLSPECKAQRSTYILYNNGTLAQLEAQVKALYSQLTQAP